MTIQEIENTQKLIATVEEVIGGPYHPWHKANFLECLADAKAHIEAGEHFKALVQIRLAELHV